MSRCLSAGADSLALSGGFDSVSLAVVAAEQTGGTSPLQAISLRFPNGVCDEGDTQTSVARALGMPQRMLTIQESLGGKNPVEGALACSRVLPCPVFSPWQSMYTGLFKTAREPDGFRTLMGTGGDDMFTVDFSYGADCLRSLHLPALWRFFRSWQRTSPFDTAVILREVLLNGAVKPVAREALSAALGWAAPDLRDRARAWRLGRRALPAWFSRADQTLVSSLIERKRVAGNRIDASRGGGGYVRAMRSLTLRPLLLLELEQAFSWGRMLGGTFLYPYFDRDLVELSLRTHPEHLIAGGLSKAPLRQLVAQRLPQVRLPSKKVDFGQMLHQVLRAHANEIWQSLRTSLRIAEANLVDPDKFVPLVDAFLAGDNDKWMPAWFGLSTEVWLREQRLTN